MESGISQYSPSFSSTLLDAIYRSIDQGEDETMRNEHNYSSGAGANVRGVFKNEEEIANFRRACMIDKWMEKKASEKAVAQRKFAADLQMKRSRKPDRTANPSWSSIDSAAVYGGDGFYSSSDYESFPLPRPRPVRTGGMGVEKEKIGNKNVDSDFDRRGRRGFSEELDPKPKDEGGFLKTKSRALKIYGDLKKGNQPTSPGGKLAGFLNSLFAGAGKHKVAGSGGHYTPSLKSTNPSTCSSASSFSRSCLSKTPSSRGKSSNGAKGSVRFSPVSVIVDEDCPPCGHKSLLQNNNNNNNNKCTSKFKVSKNDDNIDSIRNVINGEIMVHVMEKNRRVDAMDLLQKYQIKAHVKKQAFNQDFHDREEDDDAASYASSDLFELDNLSAIGMERYREELPVYETTHLDHTDRVVANGLIF